MTPAAPTSGQSVQKPGQPGSIKLPPQRLKSPPPPSLPAPAAAPGDFAIMEDDDSELPF